MPIIPFEDLNPKVHESVWVAPDAWVTGDVELDEDVSFFFGAVARGDVQPIKIGRGTNVQDHAIIHSSYKKQDVVIGEYTTIGHRAVIHGAHVGDTCIIGMGSTILDDAKIGNNCIIGAHALVTERTVIPEGTLAIGMPAKPVRDLNEKELAYLIKSAENYIRVSRDYKGQNL